VTGRKRHVLVDTLGLLVAVVVHAADVQDRDGAKLVLAKARERCPRLQRLWADGNYAGQLVDWVQEQCGWVLEIVKRPAGAKGFQLLPKRWIVERTLAWLGRYRRLSKDYEATTASSEAWITIAMIHLMVRRLEPG
jgi:putative transposase